MEISWNLLLELLISFACVFDGDPVSLVIWLMITCSDAKTKVCWAWQPRQVTGDIEWQKKTSKDINGNRTARFPIGRFSDKIGNTLSTPFLFFKEINY